MNTRIKPKEIMVNLPAIHFFENENEIVSFVSAINAIIFGKSKIKYENLGILGGKDVALLYIKRDDESQQLHDEFVKLIDKEDAALHGVSEPANDVIEEVEPQEKHSFCFDCEDYVMLHIKGLEHCCCGEDWVDGKCESQ